MGACLASCSRSASKFFGVGCVKFWVSKSPRWLAIVWILPLNIICAVVFWFLYLGLLEIGFRISVDKMSMLEIFAMSFRIVLVLTPIVIWIELENATKQTAQGDFGDVAGKGVEK